MVSLSKNVHGQLVENVHGHFLKKTIRGELVEPRFSRNVSQQAAGIFR
jgi:hypothetical protein